ncbi:tetratricopeptide repeat protein [Streptomyces diastatochromogenes]|uniref:tetratricopeptide repeat protein n=1 Tax=Streptomyces diastatochromogenes TaxID=42236 RepID=UPI002F26858D
MGRRGELAVFRETFARNPEDVDFPYLFHVHGNGGVGKSTLVRQWETTAREQGSVVTAFVDDDVTDALEAMETISARLARQGQPLKKFDKQMAFYRQRRHQAENTAAAQQPNTGEPGDVQSAPASPSSTVAAQVGLVGLGMLPGLGAFAGAIDPQQVALGTDRMRAMLNMRLRSHDDVQLVMRPVERLTPVFLEDLADVAERCERVVLFFDVYERTGPVLDAWLQSVVFGEGHEGLPANVQIVLSGQLRLDTRIWGDRLDQVTEVPLGVFTEEEVRTLLAKHGVVDESSVELVLRLSERLPLLVDMLARGGPNPSDSISDPSETAVERFLKWEPDAQRREAALACALPLNLDEDIYRAVVPEGTVDDYPWLRALAFVTPQAGRCRYHDVVRSTMLRLQRTRSPARWQQQHTLLADTYERWRLSAEAGLGSDTDTHWGDANWREHRLNETYHRLCADPRAALPDALLQVVHAADHDIATLRRWVQTLTQAGRDTETSTLITQSKQLEKVAEQENATIAVLTILLTLPELTIAARALTHTVRGREHRVSSAYQHALTDYASAQRIAPAIPRIYAGRAETYRLMGRYGEALVEFNHAIEIDPHLEWAIVSRGETHQAMGCDEDALADYARALEIDPQSIWAIAGRAQIYRGMGRYDDALTEFAHVLGIDPRFAWAFVSRARTYEIMGRYDDALDDLARALEIDPRYVWAIANRGEIYRLTQRYDDALAEFSRALEIDPRYAWGIASRAQVYQAMENYEDALAEFSRAIEIDSRLVWPIISRGETHYARGNYGDAISDFTRALEVDPQCVWAVAMRGETHRAMGSYGDALSDLTRAIEVDPQYAWGIARRGETHRVMGSYGDAISDLTRAIEVDPQLARALECRGEAYRLTRRYGDALADFTRAIEINPRLEGAIASRGETHRAMGNHGDAFVDLARAIEIAPENGWIEYLYGRILWLMGQQEQGRECWLRAARIFADTASAGGADANWARGNLVVVHCAMSDWAMATAQLNVLLEDDLPMECVRDVLIDLAELEETLSVSTSIIHSFKGRLNAMLVSGEEISQL